MEVSKFNNDSDMVSTAPKFKPSFLASIAALTNSSAPSLANSAKNLAF